jgi:hypothetical protein
MTRGGIAGYFGANLPVRAVFDMLRNFNARTFSAEASNNQ